MATGLYDPAYEHDACGVGMVADLHGRPDHDIVDRGLTVLERLAHRGASGAEVETGDGAGILVQIPHRFLAAAALDAGFSLPDAGGYAVGLAFLPDRRDDALKARTVVEQTAAEEGLAVLGWRPVPTEPEGLGKTALGAMPLIEQVFLAPATDGMDTMALERRAFVVRKRAEHAVDGLYFPSLSARTIVYKGMLTSEQLREFFPDLRDPRFESGLALVHSRFSTNTFPSWPLAHPYRYLAHNGEINTLAGNRNWMRAREALLETSLIDGDLARIFPICTPGSERLRQLRRGPRVAAPGRPPTAARRADDDPRGVGEPHHDGPRPARLLPLPRVADGAVGRPGGGLLHRRDARRRGARPQRPPAGSLLGHRRRPGRARQRGRRPRHRPGARRAQGPPAAGAHVPRRHRQGPAGRGRGDQVRAGGRAPLRASGWRPTRSGSTSCRRGPCSRPSTGASSPSSACSATRPRSPG